MNSSKIGSVILVAAKAVLCVYGAVAFTLGYPLVAVYLFAVMMRSGNHSLWKCVKTGLGWPVFFLALGKLTQMKNAGAGNLPVAPLAVLTRILRRK